MSVCSWLVTEFVVCSGTISQWKWKLVVVSKSLISFTLLGGLNRWILGVKPWSLNVCGLLRVIKFENFTSQTGDAFYTLFDERSWLSQSTLIILNITELIGLTSSIELFACTKCILVLCAPSSLWKASIFVVEAWKCFDRSIRKIKLINVVLMNHAQNWLVLNRMCTWVFDLSLINCVFFIEPIWWNQLRSIMLWNSMKSIKWSWETSWCQTVNWWLEITFLY